MVVNGKARVELSNAGDFVAGEADFDLETGQITPPWDPRQSSAHRRRPREAALSRRRRTSLRLPLDTRLGPKPGNFQRRVPPRARPRRRASRLELRPQGDPGGACGRKVRPRADEVDEWQATGSYHPAGRAHHPHALHHSRGRRLDRALGHGGRSGRRGGSSSRGRVEPDACRHSQAVLAEISRRQGPRLGIGAGERRTGAGRQVRRQSRSGRGRHDQGRAGRPSGSGECRTETLRHEHRLSRGNAAGRNV